MLAGETVDLFRMGTRVPRCCPDVLTCLTRSTRHLAPAMTAMDLIDNKIRFFSVTQRIGDFLLRVPTRTDHFVLLVRAVGGAGD